MTTPTPTPIKPARPTPYRDPLRQSEEATYTFLRIRALAHLPHPETSTAFLRRLRDDAGVKKVMRKYKWTVGTLLEMEPIGNTSAAEKTLGLNRGRGEVIEVRLRTDWYDGWRDYKTVRRTLCHELAHNVFDEHDRRFWELTNKLEKEVEVGDWTMGGRALTDQVFYNPPEEVVERWKGGEVRLGGGAKKGGLALQGEEKGSMREVLARAAEERMKRLAAGGGGPAGSGGKS